MRLKTKLVLAITGLVVVMVTVLSALYLSQLLLQQVEQSYSSNDILAHQILFATRNALEGGVKNHPVNPGNTAALRETVAASLREDQGLTALLNSVIRYSPTVFDISITDWNNRVLLSTDVAQMDQPAPPRPDFAQMHDASLIHLIAAVFGKPRVYNVSLGLARNNQPFLTVRVGIRSSFLSNSFEPRLIGALTFSGVAILSALLVSAFLANLALRPLAQISERLDALTQAEMAGELDSDSSADAVVQVSYKIERLGRRMRNVEEVFSALKENLDQIMTNLEDGILLFTRDARAVLVSDSVERFLGLQTQARSWARRSTRSSTAPPCLDRRSATPSTPASRSSRKKSPLKPAGGSRFRSTSSTTTTSRTRIRPSVPCSPCTTWSRSAKSRASWNCPAASQPLGGSPPAWGMRSRTPSMPSSFTLNCCAISSTAQTIPARSAISISSRARFSASTAWSRRSSISPAPSNCNSRSRTFASGCVERAPPRLGRA